METPVVRIKQEPLYYEETNNEGEPTLPLCVIHNEPVPTMLLQVQYIHQEDNVFKVLVPQSTIDCKERSHSNENDVKPSFELITEDLKGTNPVICQVQEAKCFKKQWHEDAPILTTFSDLSNKFKTVKSVVKLPAGLDTGMGGHKTNGTQPSPPISALDNIGVQKVLANSPIVQTPSFQNDVKQFHPAERNVSPPVKPIPYPTALLRAAQIQPVIVNRPTPSLTPPIVPQITEEEKPSPQELTRLLSLNSAVQAAIQSGSDSMAGKTSKKHKKKMDSSSESSSSSSESQEDTSSEESDKEENIPPSKTLGPEPLTPSKMLEPEPLTPSEMLEPEPMTPVSEPLPPVPTRKRLTHHNLRPHKPNLLLQRLKGNKRGKFTSPIKSVKPRLKSTVLKRFKMNKGTNSKPMNKTNGVMEKAFMCARTQAMSLSQSRNLKKSFSHLNTPNQKTDGIVFANYENDEIERDKIESSKTKPSKETHRKPAKKQIRKSPEIPEENNITIQHDDEPIPRPQKNSVPVVKNIGKLLSKFINPEKLIRTPSNNNVSKNQDKFKRNSDKSITSADKSKSSNYKDISENAIEKDRSPALPKPYEIPSKPPPFEPIVCEEMVITAPMIDFPRRSDNLYKSHLDREHKEKSRHRSRRKFKHNKPESSLKRSDTSDSSNDSNSVHFKQLPSRHFQTLQKTNPSQKLLSTIAELPENPVTTPNASENMSPESSIVNLKPPEIKKPTKRPIYAKTESPSNDQPLTKIVKPNQPPKMIVKETISPDGKREVTIYVPPNCFQMKDGQIVVPKDFLLPYLAKGGQLKLMFQGPQNVEIKDLNTSQTSSSSNLHPLQTVTDILSKPISSDVLNKSVLRVQPVTFSSPTCETSNLAKVVLPVTSQQIIPVPQVVLPVKAQQKIPVQMPMPQKIISLPSSIPNIINQPLNATSNVNQAVKLMTMNPVTKKPISQLLQEAVNIQSKIRIVKPIKQFSDNESSQENLLTASKLLSSIVSMNKDTKFANLPSKNDRPLFKPIYVKLPTVQRPNPNAENIELKSKGCQQAPTTAKMSSLDGFKITTTPHSATPVVISQNTATGKPAVLEASQLETFSKNQTGTITVNNPNNISGPLIMTSKGQRFLLIPQTETLSVPASEKQIVASKTEVPITIENKPKLIKSPKEPHIVILKPPPERLKLTKVKVPKFKKHYFQETVILEKDTNTKVFPNKDQQQLEQENIIQSEKPITQGEGPNKTSNEIEEVFTELVHDHLSKEEQTQQSIINEQVLEDPTVEQLHQEYIKEPLLEDGFAQQNVSQETLQDNSNLPNLFQKEEMLQGSMDEQFLHDSLGLQKLLEAVDQQLLQESMLNQSANDPHTVYQTDDGQQAIYQTDSQPVQYQTIDGQPVQYQTIDGQPVQYETIDGQPVQYQTIDGQPVQYQTIDGQPVQYQTIDGQPVQYQTIDGQPVQYQTIDGQPVQYQTIDEQQVQYQTTDGQQVFYQTEDGQRIVYQTEDGKPEGQQIVQGVPEQQLLQEQFFHHISQELADQQISQPTLFEQSVVSESEVENLVDGPAPEQAPNLQVSQEMKVTANLNAAYESDTQSIITKTADEERQTPQQFEEKQTVVEEQTIQQEVQNPLSLSQIETLETTDGILNQNPSLELNEQFLYVDNQLPVDIYQQSVKQYSYEEQKEIVGSDLIQNSLPIDPELLRDSQLQLTSQGEEEQLENNFNQEMADIYNELEIPMEASKVIEMHGEIPNMTEQMIESFLMQSNLNSLDPTNGSINEMLHFSGFDEATSGITSSANKSDHKRKLDDARDEPPMKTCLIDSNHTDFNNTMVTLDGVEIETVTEEIVGSNLQAHNTPDNLMLKAINSTTKPTVNKRKILPSRTVTQQDCNEGFPLITNKPSRTYGRTTYQKNIVADETDNDSRTQYLSQKHEEPELPS